MNRSPRPRPLLVALFAAFTLALLFADGAPSSAQRYVTTSTSPGVSSVPTTRTLTCGAGLTGCGTLAADRTLAVSFGTSSSTACVGDDSRLSNARTPTAHASTHGIGGADAVSIASTQVSDSTSTGRSVLTAANAAAARTAIGAGTFTSPLTTSGDLLYYLASDTRLAIGSTGYALGVVGGLPAWALPSALVTASGDAAAMRTALGVSSSSAPTTLAAQALAVASSRRGPVVAFGWTDSDYYTVWNNAVFGQAPGGGGQPTITQSSSGVMVVYSPWAGGYDPMQMFASCQSSGANRGYVIGHTGSSMYLRSVNDAVVTTFTNAVSTIGWHAVAWSVSSGGAVHYSIDGGAATNAGGAGNFTPRNGDDVVVGRGRSANVFSEIGIAYIALWASVLTDGNLASLSSSPSAGAPTLVSTPAWEWAAAAHSGCERVTAGSTVSARVGSPATWMP